MKEKKIQKEDRKRVGKKGGRSSGYGKGEGESNTVRDQGIIPTKGRISGKRAGP